MFSQRFKGRPQLWLPAMGIFQCYLSVIKSSAKTHRAPALGHR